MPTKRYKPEQIMTVLRRVEVVIANGKLTPQACREAGISEQTFYLMGISMSTDTACCSLAPT